AAGAESAAFGMVDQHDMDVVIADPAKQRLAHHLAHLRGQGVDRLGPVEADPADTLLDTDQDVIGHWRSMSRLTITRMIWFVPSRIEWTRRSRQKRSIG